MIKLATVFSGIGAIEHALNRMQIENDIVFACDNGEVDILTKEIELNLDSIENELIILRNTINTIIDDKKLDNLYKEQLNSMLVEAEEELSLIKQRIDSAEIHDLSLISDIINKILEMKSLKPEKGKEYATFGRSLENGNERQSVFHKMQIALEIINDYRKDNSIESLKNGTMFTSSDGINWESVSVNLLKVFDEFESIEARKTIRKVQDLSQRTSQLHEKINYLAVQEELNKLGEDWYARKKYVDNLYTGLNSKNKVKQSYIANYKVNEDDFHWNVAFLNGKQYTGKVDLFVGGSPCQSFSLVGKQRGLEDTRGTLFYEYARLIDEIKPKVFIYENVRAVTSHDDGRTWAKMQEVFGELGYNFKWQILNAKDYGIPQNRERLFVVGFRNDLQLQKSFEFPKPIALEKKMKDFLLDNAPGGYFLPKKGVEFVTMEKNLQKRFTQIDGDIQLCQKKNQQFNWHGDFVFQSEEEAKAKEIPDMEKYFLSEKVRKYVMATGTKNFYSRPKVDLDIARPLLTTMHKMHRAGVDNYVTTDGRLRKLTPRECLRLMGFSDNFKIVVSDTSMYQQAGNSIVVDVLIHIMSKIIESYPDLLNKED